MIWHIDPDLLRSPWSEPVTLTTPTPPGALGQRGEGGGGWNYVSWSLDITTNPPPQKKKKDKKKIPVMTESSTIEKDLETPSQLW